MSRRRAVESDELRDNDGVRPVLVLQKASALLDVFTGERYELTFPEIRQATGLPASTCARLLRTLVHGGLLERDGDRHRIGVTSATLHSVRNIARLLALPEEDFQTSDDQLARRTCSMNGLVNGSGHTAPTSA